MFVLNPGGSKGGAFGGGSSSQARQNLWFFGKLGFYFAAIRTAFVFMSGRIEGGETATADSPSSN